MDRLLRAMGLAAALLMAMPAWAADEEETAAGEEKAVEKGDPKLYATAGGLWSLAAFDVPSEVGQQDSFGVDARVGYMLHPHFALEGQYQWAARYELTGGGMHLNNVETHAGTGNAKVILFRGPLQPYLLFGAGVVNASLQHGRDRTEFAIRAGGGVTVYFSEHVGVYGEITYLKPTTSLNEFNAVPIAFGGAFRF
jgi:hypothetical protein